MKTLKDTLTSEESNILLKLNELSGMVSETGEKIASGLNEFSDIAADIFKKYLEQSGVKPGTTDESVDLFKFVILSGTKAVSDSLYAGLKSGEGVLFNGLLAAGGAEILDSMLEFRKSVDKNFPGMADTILDASAFVLTSLVAVYAPGVAIVLKATGILDKAKDFLSAETLEQTASKLNEKLQQVEEDKKLDSIYKNADKLYALSEQTSLSIRAMCNFAAAPEQIEKISRLGGLSDKSRQFMTELGKTAELLPISRDEARTRMTHLHSQLEELIDKHGLPQEVADKLRKNLETAVISGTKTLEEASGSKSLFQKMYLAQETANNLNSIFDGVNNTNISRLKAEFNNTVKDNIQGDAIKLFQEAKKHPVLARELGHDFKTELAMSRLTPSGSGRGIS